MTAKSTIDVEVNDGPFDAFAKKFEQYKEALKQAGKSWDSHQQSWAKAAQTAAEMAKVAEEAKKVNRFGALFTKGLAAARRELGGIVKESQMLARNVLSITRSLLKWAGITAVFGGLAGGGSLFGLRSLASNVGGDRRQAMGLNTNSTSVKAFGINYGKFVDTDSFLANVADARQDITKHWTLNAAGLSDAQMQGKDTTQIAQMLIPLLQSKFAQGGKTLQGAMAFGLTQFTDLQGLNRLSNASPDELARAASGMEGDKKRLALSDDIQQKWQYFGQQLNRAGDQIENTLVKGLTTLIGPLTKLSASVANALSTVFANPALPGYLDSMGKGIERFAKYINSEDINTDVSAFLSNVGKIGSALGQLADLIGAFLPDKPDANKPDLGNTGTGEDPLVRRIGTGLNNAIQTFGANPYKYLPDTDPRKKFYDLETKYSLPAGLLDRTWHAESGRGGANTPDSGVGPNGGAKGPFQFEDATFAQYNKDAKAVHDIGASAQAAAIHYAHLATLYPDTADKTDKMAAAYNMGEGAFAKILAAHPTDWKKYLDANATKYVNSVGGTVQHVQSVVPNMPNTGPLGNPANPGTQTGATPAKAQVTIQNQTGGSAVVTTNQLAY